MELNIDLNQSDKSEIVIINNKRSSIDSNDQNISKKKLKLHNNFI